MVTTFNARLLHLANKLNNPIITRKRTHIDSTNISDNSSLTNSNQYPPENSTMKRQNYSYAHAPNLTHDDDTTNNSCKRRRQMEELQYSASTIKTALTNAGQSPMSVMGRRRERALPWGSVDMECARVVTSSEFDDEMNSGDLLSAEALVIHDRKTQDDQQAEEEDEEKEDASNDDYGVSSMYMLAGLIQSTRHYYNFSSDDTTTATTPYTSALSTNGTSNNYDKQATNHRQVYSNYNDEKLREDDSEGFSSWTPSSSSCNEFNDSDKKNIDDDNRSDGKSSDDGADSISSSGAQSPKAEERKENYVNLAGAFSVIGWIDDGRVLSLGLIFFAGIVHYS